MILSPFPMRRRKPAPQTEAPQPIDESLLDSVSGGEATAPRDPASGLATGKRMHKPVT